MSSLSDGTIVITSTIDDSVNPAVSDSDTVNKDRTLPLTTVSVDTITNGIDDPILTLSTIETNTGVDFYEIEYITDNNAPGVNSTTTTLT